MLGSPLDCLGESQAFGASTTTRDGSRCEMEGNADPAAAVPKSMDVLRKAFS